MNVHSVTNRRRGMTLIELLIVITIMTILMAVAIPMVRPAFRDRNLREASRLVNTFITGARSRAAGVQRPVGVWIERVDNSQIGSRTAQRLYMAEVAPPFTGSVLGARATVEPISLVLSPPAALANTPLGRLHFWNSTGTPSGDEIFLRNLIEVGETFVVKFDHKGFIYPGERLPDVSSVPFFVIGIPQGIPPGTTHPASPPLPPAFVGTSYSILRGPRRSNVNPLTLPGDTVIDLSVSGVGTSGYEFDSGAGPLYSNLPIIITFTPTGRVDYVFVGGSSYRPFGSIHLLIGRRSQVVEPTVPNLANAAVEANLTDLDNIWISIGHQTGRVVTSANTETLALPAATTVPNRIRAARSLARSAIRKGGR